LRSGTCQNLWDKHLQAYERLSYALMSNFRWAREGVRVKNTHE